MLVMVDFSDVFQIEASLSTGTVRADLDIVVVRDISAQISDIW